MQARVVTASGEAASPGVRQPYFHRATPMRRRKLMNPERETATAARDRKPRWMSRYESRKRWAKCTCAYSHKIRLPDHWRDYTELEVKPDGSSWCNVSRPINSRDAE